jgi:hypothetical protein
MSHACVLSSFDSCGRLPRMHRLSNQAWKARFLLVDVCSWALVASVTKKSTCCCSATYCSFRKYLHHHITSLCGCLLGRPRHILDSDSFGRAVSTTVPLYFSFHTTGFRVFPMVATRYTAIACSASPINILGSSRL